MTGKALHGERDSLWLVEESAALLRRAPALAWATYLTGAAPYGLGLIWFWLENTRSAFARQNLAWTAGAMALLFIWKQVFEALFMAQLRTLAGGKSGGAPGLSQLTSLAVRQAAWQPTSFLVLPLALLATIPLPYALLFYRQFSLAAAEGDPSALRTSFQASLFGKGSLWTLTGIAALGALLLYANLLAAVIFGAQMASSFFGVENLETGVLALLSNTTVHFTIGVVVYLALDVLFDCAAALQAFRAVSVRSGDDILVALKRGVTASLVLGVLAIGTVRPVMAQDRDDSRQARELDRAIGQTLQQPEFAWRLEQPAGDTPPFMAAIFRGIDAAAEWVGEMMSAIARWFEPKRPERRDGKSGEGGGATVQNWMIALAVIGVAALVLIVVLNRRTSRRAQQPAAAAPAADVDLRDESLLASTLPEDEWLAMAESHLRAGEPRLALRALHLACLRALSGRGLIAVQRAKTGMDYLDEVRRRARQQPELASTFAQNVRLFELGWYSAHPVSLEMVESYRQGMEEIRAHAG